MNDRDKITAYLSGILSPQETLEVEEKLDNKPAFRTLYEELRDLKNDLQPVDSATKSLFKSALKESVSSSPQPPRKPSWYYLLFVLLGLAISFIFWYFALRDTPLPPVVAPQPPVIATTTSSQLIDIYTTNRPEENSFRGNNNLSDTSLNNQFYRDAHKAMKNKEWYTALELFKELEQLSEETNPNELDAVYFYGALNKLILAPCDSTARARLATIPNRDSYNFRPISQEVLTIVEKVTCE